MTTVAGGEKEKFSICTCDVDEDGNIKVNKKKIFEFMLNPSSYNHTYQIEYNKKEAIGQAGSDTKFSGIKPEKLKISTLLDGTGVVPVKKNIDVEKDLKALTDIVYKYDGQKHEPNYVRVLWGRQIFFGRLDSMSVENTLFKPSGVPLRAKIELSFSGFMSKEEEALRANRSSPDMSHSIEVKAGDTLPLLCYQVYKDCSYYREIARINDITNFRKIQPGTRLHFPPLR